MHRIFHTLIDGRLSGSDALEINDARSSAEMALELSRLAYL